MDIEYANQAIEYHGQIVQNKKNKVADLELELAVKEEQLAREEKNGA